MAPPRGLKHATDHRALVLESVATAPGVATLDTIANDCTGPDFTRKNVLTMVNQLMREGLIGRIDQGHFLTRAGFSWLTEGRFDRALPGFVERPRARGRARKLKHED